MPFQEASHTPSFGGLGFRAKPLYPLSALSPSLSGGLGKTAPICALHPKGIFYENMGPYGVQCWNQRIQAPERAVNVDSKVIVAGRGTLAVFGSFVIGAIFYYILQGLGLNDDL